MNRELANELVQSIKDAFLDTPYPGDSRVGDESEVGEFVGKRWQDITSDNLQSVTNPHFFTKEGRRYYAPAYMVGALEHPELHFSVREGIIRGLAPVNDPDWKNRNITIHEIFSPDERLVIRSFFESYERLFPFPDNENLTAIGKKQTEEDRRALQVAIEYWQEHS